MSQGYIFLGVDDTNKTDNIVAAYTLSLSLKIFDPTRETCVVVNKLSDVPAKFENGFDYIVELPFGRTEINHKNILIDFWQMYYCSPFDESMFVNTYSLAVSNIDSLWDFPSRSGIAFATATNFKGELTGKKSKFNCQEKNNLPKFDSDVMYFNKNQIPSEFFKMSDAIFKEWRKVYSEFIDESSPGDFDFTLMVNIISYLLGEEYTFPVEFVYTDLNIPVIDPNSDYSWPANISDYTIWVTNKNQIKINNHRQIGIICYHNPKFITEKITSNLYANYKKNKTKIRTQTTR